MDAPEEAVRGAQADDDRIVPIGAAALSRSKNAILKIDPGAPHGLADTHKDQFNAGLLAFLNT